MLLSRLFSRSSLLIREPRFSYQVISWMFMIICGCIASVLQAQTKGRPLVLRDVTVVDTRTGALAPHRSLVIRNDLIEAIQADGKTFPPDAEVVSGAGKFVVPGFADMHIHVTELADQSRLPLELLVANGVTLVREETTTPAMKDRAQELNSEAEQGRFPAPEIVFAGVEEHLPPNIDAATASNNGMPSMDHLGAGPGLVLDCSSEAAAIRRDLLAQGYKPAVPPSKEFIENPRAFDAMLNTPFYQHALETYDPVRCKNLAETFAKNHTWQTLTLIRLKTQDWGNDPHWRDNPALKYIPPTKRAEWNALGDRFGALPKSDVQTLQDYYGLQLKVTKLMVDNGVRILTGSDVGGVWLVPGFSLHDEFHELASAGLPPLAILQATTLEPAIFLHREDRDGTVEVGKAANLVILDANPIADSRSLDKIHAVVLRGRMISRTELDGLLRQVPPTSH